MTKEEILERSRKENKNVDLYEYEIRNKAAVLSSVTGIALSSVFYVLLLIVEKKSHSEIFAIMTGMEAVLFCYKYIKLRQRHELVVTIIYGLSFLLFLAVFIMNLFA